MPEDSLIGTVLGQYEIESIIGKGGMATVYKGCQVAVNRTVAIKVLPSSFMHDETFMTRFRQEAEVAASLEHIRILPLYDYGEEGGVPFIVMRYIDGGTVRDHTQKGPASTELTLRVISQVAEALDYAHARNVIHRDLKPSNIMLDAEFNTYLADFGTAKLRDRSASLTGSGIVGTPAYMAPEQSMPGQVTPKVDLYALGVTLFEMIAGRVPYSADTPIVQILMHIQHPVPSLREYNPSVTTEVDAIIQRAMAKTPEERFDSASELAHALKEAVAISGGWSQEKVDVNVGAVLAKGLEDFMPEAEAEEDMPPVEYSDGAFGLVSDSPFDDALGTSSVPPTHMPVPPEDLGAAYAEEVGVPLPAQQSKAFTSLHPLLVTTSGEAFELTSRNTLLGRDDHQKGIFVDIDLTALDSRKRSSRSHARILERGGEYIIWDLHSMNGTYVNGERMPEGGRQIIQDGDLIQFGKGGVILAFRL